MGIRSRLKQRKAAQQSGAQRPADVLVDGPIQDRNRRHRDMTAIRNIFQDSQILGAKWKNHRR